MSVLNEGLSVIIVHELDNYHELKSWSGDGLFHKLQNVTISQNCYESNGNKILSKNLYWKTSSWNTNKTWIAYSYGT